MEQLEINQAILKGTLAEIKAPSQPISTTVDACVICKTEVLSVEYGWQSPHGCKTYVVPRRSYQAQTATSSLDNTSRTRRTGPSVWTGRRPRRNARPGPRVSPDGALIRRRHIYARGLYSLHVGTNRLSRFRDLSPRLFSRDAELISRARKWIRRELQVFDFLQVDGAEEEGVTRRANNAEFLIEYIVAILKTVDIKGSGGQAEDMLQEFLGRENTQLFLHEIKAWLRSPYTSLDDWDRHVQYGETPSRGVRMAKTQPTALELLNSSQLQLTSNSLSSQSFSTSNSPEYPTCSRYRPYPNGSSALRERR
ncbi:MAG: hypothetical protein LQ348_000029 [Seirophora lacunosa]|nr:MAG: hypothetical protein LQ348_000029 [Seirophora lacunosa]